MKPKQVVVDDITINNEESKYIEYLDLPLKEPVWYPFSVKAGQSISVKGRVNYLNFDKSDGRQAVMLIKTFDEAGDEVVHSFEDVFNSNLLKSQFIYLSSTNNKNQKLWTFIVPDDVVLVSIGFSRFNCSEKEKVKINDFSIDFEIENPKLECLEPSSFDKIDTLRLPLEVPIWYSIKVKQGQILNIEALVDYLNFDSSDGRNAVMLIKAFNKKGEELTIELKDLYWSKLFNSYFKYLPTTNNSIQELYKFMVPVGVSEIHFGFSRFKCLETQQVILSNIKLYYGKEFELIRDQSYFINVGLGKVTFSFEALSNTDQVEHSAALMSFTLMNAQNEALLPIDSLAINKNIGAYKYLTSGSGLKPETNEIEVQINDKNAKRLKVQFHPWKNTIDSYIQKNIDLKYIRQESLSNKIEKHNRFIQSLSSNDKIILLYTTAPYVGHETLELRPNRMAKEYIKLGYKVVFFSFSQIPEELSLPKHYNNCLYQCPFFDLTVFSSLIAHKELKEKIFICSSFPDVLALTTINKLKLSDWKLVYEIRDDMEEFNRVGYSKWYNSKLEVDVIRLVDKVFTVSPRLAQKASVMAGIYEHQGGNNKVSVIQNAAPDTLIDKTKSLRATKVAMSRNKSNKVGYIGHLTPAWFDWVLIINSAKANPNIVYEIIGHGMPKNLELPENVIYLGPKNHDEFIEISKQWRLGLIPFIKSPLTYGVDPNKIYEYLAVGLMVVTADMGSVKECPATYVYEQDEGFDRALKQALNTSYDKEMMREIRDYVSKSRWSMRSKKLLKELYL